MAIGSGNEVHCKHGLSRSPGNRSTGAPRFTPDNGPLRHYPETVGVGEPAFDREIGCKSGGNFSRGTAMVDARWRRKVEALQRAGLTHVAANTWDQIEIPPRPVPPTIEVTAAVAPVESIAATPEPAPQVTATSNLASPRPDPITELAHELNENKPKQLEILTAEVAACTLCSGLASTRTQTVFSDGTPEAEICFVGEAPGADEDAQGVPFVGKAGQLLTKIIEACKLRREEVYICNTLKCRPPGNRNPTPDEIEHCRPFLERQLALVRPKIMVALGKFAAAHLLQEKPEKVPIMKLRGQIREYCGIPFMITLHPAYLLRNPSAKKEVWEDMKEVMRFIGRPID